MKRVICLILVVVFMLSMACTAFATPANSAGDNNNPPSGGSSSGSSSSPKTGDMIQVWAMLMMLAMLAMAGVTALYRKVF